MKKIGLIWDSERENYIKASDATTSEDEAGPTDNVVEMSTKTSAASTESSAAGDVVSSNADLSHYLPLLETLESHKDQLLALLSPASSGNIPRYGVPGVPKTKSIYMSDLLAGLISEFSEEKNLSQRVIVEGALA